MDIIRRTFSESKQKRRRLWAAVSLDFLGIFVENTVVRYFGIMNAIENGAEYMKTKLFAFCKLTKLITNDLCSAAAGYRNL